MVPYFSKRHFISCGCRVKDQPRHYVRPQACCLERNQGCHCTANWLNLAKEYVASLIGIYKNNCAVSCVGANFVILQSLYLARTQLLCGQFTRNKKECLSFENPTKVHYRFVKVAPLVHAKKLIHLFHFITIAHGFFKIEFFITKIQLEQGVLGYSNL